MWKELLPGLRIKLFMTVVLGVGYPLLMTGVSQVLFSKKANGSLIAADGKTIGSEIIGQNFARPEYFHPRPSAAGDKGYDAANSGGSNYGPMNQKLVDRVKASIDQVRQENPDYHGPIPVDLVTASASGLDPHLSPDSTAVQIARVAKARGVGADVVAGLVREFTERPTLGVLGDPRVNVLLLNLALDRALPMRK
jgi:potassium-transporting ATPase KdpC subunit